MICTSVCKSFLPLQVGVSTDVVVFRSRGGGTQHTKDFWRKIPLDPLSVFLLLCTDFSHQLRCGAYFILVTFIKKAQVGQLEPNLLLCIGLQLVAGHSWVAPRQPAGVGSWQQPPTAKPIPGLLLEALHGVSDKPMCELGALIRTAALCTS